MFIITVAAQNGTTALIRYSGFTFLDLVRERLRDFAAYAQLIYTGKFLDDFPAGDLTVYIAGETRTDQCLDS